MHKRQIKVFILLAMLWSIFIFPAMAYEKIAVEVNGSRVLNLAEVERVAIANPDIADVVVISGSEVMLVGKTSGTTNMHVWSGSGRESYLIEVITNDVPIANEIKRILGLENIQVSKAGKTVILEGKIKDKYQKNRAEQIASAYGEKVVNLLEISQPIQVKIEAKIIEISKVKSTDLGIKWGNDPGKPGSFQFGQTVNPLEKYGDGEVYNQALARPGNVGGKSWGSLGGYWSINAELNALVAQGAAKVLSQPNMVTVSGENASILVGGSIPIPISNLNGSLSVDWKEYGIKLDVTPEVNSEGLINGKIKAEVSALDWSSNHQVILGSNLKIPPLTIRKAETVIALSSGQTMAIGGLYSNVESKNITKLPLLGDLPVLGALFTSKSFGKDETELIILITPTIIDAADYIPNKQLTTEMKSAIAK